MKRSISWLNNILWLLLIITLTCIMLCRVILHDFASYPLDIREGAGPALTWLILHKGFSTIYSNDVMPIYNNVYGIGFSLFTIPWALYFKKIAIAHRLSDTFALILTILVFYQISYKLSQSRLVSLALIVAFTSNAIWSGVGNATWGDAAGMLFSQLILLLLISTYKTNWKIIGTLALTFIAFIIKPYYALYGIAVFIWLPAVIGVKQSIKWYCIGLLLVLVFLVLSEHFFPWYLWNTVIQYSAYLGGSKAHLYDEIKAFWINNSFWIWFLLGATAFYSTFIDRLPSLIRHSPTSNETYKSPAFGSLAFWIYMTGFFALVIYYMAQNTGREHTYIVELFIPQLYFLICSILNIIIKRNSRYSWLQKHTKLLFFAKCNEFCTSRKNILIIFLLISTLSPGIYTTFWDYSVTFRQYINSTPTYTELLSMNNISRYAQHENIWDKQAEKPFTYIKTFLKHKNNVFHSPWLTNILLDNNLPIYDSSHTQHFRGPFQDKSPRDYFGLHLGSLLSHSKRELAEQLWLNYWNNINDSIKKRKFDLIVLEDENYSKVGYLLMFDYAAYYASKQLDFNIQMHQFYQLIKKNYKIVGHVKQMNLTIYEPRVN